MNGLPVESALAHARAMSICSGDGIVAHTLADEIERLRLQLKQARAETASRLQQNGIIWMPATPGDDMTAWNPSE